MKKNTTMRKTTTGYAMALISSNVDARAGRPSSVNIQESKDGLLLTLTKTSTYVRCASVGACTAKAVVFLPVSSMNQRKYLLMTMRLMTASLTLHNAANDLVT